MTHFPLQLETKIIKNTSPCGDAEAPMTDYLLAYLSSWVSLVERQLQETTMKVEQFFGKVFIKELKKARDALIQHDLDALLPLARQLIKRLENTAISLPLTLINTLDSAKTEIKALSKKRSKAA